MNTAKRISICLLVLFLCGCGHTGGAVPGSAASIDDSSDTLDVTEYHWSGQPFQMISGTDYTNYGNGNAKGFYSVFPNEDGSSNVLYIDYATKKQVYLCAAPNCEHRTEACTSWVPPFEGAVIPAVTEHALFLVYSARNAASRIEQLDLNGNRVKTVFTLENGGTLENAIAANDTTLVVSVQDVSAQAGKVFAESSLQAIDLSTGKATLLFSLQQQIGDKPVESAALAFRGVTQTGFLVETLVQHPYETAGKDVDAAFESMLNAMRKTVYEIPYEGAQARELLSGPANRFSVAVLESALLCAEQTETGVVALKTLDLQTLATHTVVEDVSTLGVAHRAQQLTAQDVVFRAYFDGKLFLNLLEQDSVAENGDMEVVFAGFCVDTTSWEIKPIQLKNSYHATTVPVDILAQYEEKFLVFSNIAPAAAQGLGGAGLVREMGLIAKDDYFNAVPNYQRIDALRYYH